MFDPQKNQNVTPLVSLMSFGDGECFQIDNEHDSAISAWWDVFI